MLPRDYSLGPATPLGPGDLDAVHDGRRGQRPGLPTPDNAPGMLLGDPAPY